MGLRSQFRAVLLLATAAALAGCGLFGGKDDDDELKPAELQSFEPTLRIKRLWSTKLGKEADFLRVALRPASDGERLYAASIDGKVYAIEPESGKSLWRTDLELDLTAGPGVGSDIVVVMGADGILVALDADSGAERWRTDIDGESLAVPLVHDELVVVQTIDNRLRAVSVFEGAARWTIEQSTPVLTLRGSATPLVIGSNVVAGFDNGRLMAIDADSGDVDWESMLSPPTGRSDLERLSDIDGRMAVIGQDIYAAGYQGSLASIAAESGQVLWQQEISTYVGVSADWGNLYTSNDNGEVIALVRRTGSEAWRQDALLRRWPTLPVPFHTAVVTGDFEGYLHFLSNVDGELAARVRFGKKAISSEPLVVANRLYVQSDSGALAAFAVEEPRRPRGRAPDISEDAANEDEGA
ncbi:MAG: outer membrane protein assembly factor BamB [Pseudomonadota bacterium]